MGRHLKPILQSNTKKWADFKDFFEKKAEIQNSVSEVRSWSEREN